VSQYWGLFVGVKGEKAMVKSKITGRTYSPDNSSVVYLANLLQAARYLQNGAEEDLVDILYENTRNDCLVFVFRRSENIKRLYGLWQEHKL
jgi:hypothetical protein